MSKPAICAIPMKATQLDGGESATTPAAPDAATKFVRIKPTSKRSSHGIFHRATNSTLDFRRERGWYEVPVDVADKLEGTRLYFEGREDDRTNPLVFDIARTLEEAEEIQRRDTAEQDAKKEIEEAKIGSASRPIRPTVLHTRDELAEAQAEAVQLQRKAAEAAERLERLTRR